LWQAWPEGLDVVLCFYLDAVAFEDVECVFGEGFVEHWEDLLGHVVYGDFDVGD